MQETVERLKLQYNVLAVVPLEDVKIPICEVLKNLYKEEYTPAERIVFTLYDNVDQVLTDLHKALIEVDITPCFVILVTTDNQIDKYLLQLIQQGHEVIEGIRCDK